MGIKEELGELEYLSLVSKVCTELDNHLGMNEKTLAEFIIDLAEKHKNMDMFRKALIENGAEFSGGLMRSIYDLVHRMKSLAGQSAKVMEEAMAKVSDPVLNEKRAKFTGLAIPDDFGRAKDLLDVRLEKRFRATSCYSFVYTVYIIYCILCTLLKVKKTNLKKNKKSMT